MREGEWVRESPAAFPGAEPPDADGGASVWCVRIIDAVDRRPIAGALVQVPNHPSEGVPAAELHHQCVRRADEHGWVRLPWAGVAGWRDYVFADAPGYAAHEYCDPGSVECALQRGTDVPVLLLDYTGRPVSGGRIALNLGCGHVPDQRSALTDANGRATLRDILPSRTKDILVVAPGCHSGATGLHGTWRPGGPPVLIDVSPGITVEGRVLGRDGGPVAGVRVGARGRQRPWTRTDVAGRFRLVGVSAWSAVAFEPPSRLGLAEGWFTAPPEGVERTLVLGEPVRGVLLAIRARAPTGEPAAGVRISVVRASDGLTATGRSGDGGDVEFSVAPGRYQVLADGELGTWGTATGAVDVRKGDKASTTLTVPRNPTVRVDASRVLGMRVGLTTARAFRRLEPAEIDGKDVPVPAGVRATFRVSQWERRELTVNHVDVPEPGSTVVLEGAPVTWLRARLLGPDGEPVQGTLSVRRELGTVSFGEDDEPRAPATEVAAQTRLVGTVTWTASPEDDALSPVHGDITLPPGGGELDLGEIRLTEPRGPELRVVLPADLQGAEGSVTVSLLRSNALFWNALAADGTVSTGLSSVGEGDRLLIRLDAPGVLPLSFRAPGPPPWTVEWPTASLRISVASEDEEPMTEAVAIVDGVVFEGAFESGSALHVRGLAPGEHDVVIAERDHVAKILHLVVREGEQRDLSVALATRER
jgi:hypothetical protein